MVDNRRVYQWCWVWFTEPSPCKKCHCRLPHFFVYVAYAGCLATCVTGSVVILIYGQQFGRATALRWVATMFLSFFESVLFFEPVKVMYTHDDPTCRFATYIRCCVHACRSLSLLPSWLCLLNLRPQPKRMLYTSKTRYNSDYIVGFLQLCSRLARRWSMLQEQR